MRPIRSIDRRTSGPGVTQLADSMTSDGCKTSSRGRCRDDGFIPSIGCGFTDATISEVTTYAKTVNPATTRAWVAGGLSGGRDAYAGAHGCADSETYDLPPADGPDQTAAVVLASLGDGFAPEELGREAWRRFRGTGCHDASQHSVQSAGKRMRVISLLRFATYARTTWSLLRISNRYPGRPAKYSSTACRHPDHAW